MTAEKKPAHTPGPWTYGERVDNAVMGSDNWAVCFPPGIDLDDLDGDSVKVRRWRANARLIAAAPAMLEFIRGFAVWECTLIGDINPCGECNGCRARAIVGEVENGR